MRITELVKGQTAVFTEFHSDTLFYMIGTFRFGIPVSELHGSAIKAEEKASVFLKWIKRALKEIEAN